MTSTDGYVALSTASTDAIHEHEPDSLPTESLLPQPRAKSLLHGGSLTVHPDRTYTYSYGPGGLAGLAHNYYALLCAVFASIGGLTFGYDQGVIANVLVMEDFTRRWPVSAWQKGLMTAVLELGALIGALTAGTLADRYSRRHSFFLASTVFCVGSAFQFGAQSLNHLFVGRAIGGLGVGALSMLSPLYMAEISPPEVRGSLMALEQFSIVLGVVFGFWTGYFTRDVPGSASWRIPLGIQIIPGITLAIGCIFLPSSPRLLVLQGRYDEALRNLARLRLRTPDEAGDVLLQIELLEMRVETTLVQRSVAAGAPMKHGFAWEMQAWGQLFRHKYVDRTLVGVLMMFFQQWSGINALLYYGPTLVRSIGLQGDNVTLLVAGGIGIVQFIAVLPAIVYIDRWGKPEIITQSPSFMAAGGSAIMAWSHLFIALLVRQYEDSWTAHPSAAWIAVVCIYTFTAAYGISFGPVGWVLPSEVFPLSMRSKGVALSTASNWANNFLIGLITPALMEFSAATTFILFSTACFLAYLWSTYMVPETANVSLEEIDAMFRSSAGREDRAQKQQIEEELGLISLIAGIQED